MSHTAFALTGLNTGIYCIALAKIEQLQDLDYAIF